MDIRFIKEKEKRLNYCEEQLKKEFIGIDSIIEQVVDNIKTWYIFPELQERPVVINLWGMTGCGKTSLVYRLCELLEMTDNMVYYNLAKIGEDTSESMEYDFYETLNRSNKNMVFIFDEFQFASAIDNEHKEKEQKTGLKTIWELIDTGKIYKKTSKNIKMSMENLARVYNIFLNTEPEIKDGIWLNSKKCIDKLQSCHKMDMYNMFNVNHDIPEEFEDLKPIRYWCDSGSISIMNNKSYYMSCNAIGILYETALNFGEFDGGWEEFMNNVLADMSCTDMYSYIIKQFKKTKEIAYSDYSNSLIFVMGNIDEAYKISYNMDPDMDPDQFKAITEKLTVIDIKTALQERFRNEQIARLGNILLIYPSFSKNDFENIIRLQLENYSKTVNEKLAIKIEYDNSVNEMIYKEGVFPSQGTRPLFTSVYEIVQTKIAPIIVRCIDNGLYDIDKIKMYVNENNICADIFKNGNKIYDCSFKQPLRVEPLRNNTKKDQQLITAVHESGHFVMYAKLTGKMPAKLVSATASQFSNGFMIEDIEDMNNYMTYNDYINSIKIDIAGYAAEITVFGKDNITSGASEDLRNATTTASRMIREFAMGNNSGIAVTTYLNDALSTENGAILNDSIKQKEIINKNVSELLDACLKDVVSTLNDMLWKQMFVESCKYLKDNSNMPKDIMNSIYEIIPEEERIKYVNPNNKFDNLFNQFLNE